MITKLSQDSSHRFGWERVSATSLDSWCSLPGRPTCVWLHCLQGRFDPSLVPHRPISQGPQPSALPHQGVPDSPAQVTLEDSAQSAGGPVGRGNQPGSPASPCRMRIPWAPFSAPLALHSGTCDIPISWRKRQSQDGLEPYGARWPSFAPMASHGLQDPGQASCLCLS